MKSFLLLNINLLLAAIVQPDSDGTYRIKKTLDADNFNFLELVSYEILQDV
jgi:hypothetical protein